MDPNCQTKLGEAGPPESDSDPHDVFQGGVFTGGGGVHWALRPKVTVTFTAGPPHPKPVPRAPFLPAQSCLLALQQWEEIKP